MRVVIICGAALVVAVLGLAYALRRPNLDRATEERLRRRYRGQTE